MINNKVKTLLFIFLILFCISAVNAESMENNTDYESVDIIDVKSESYIATIADTAGTFTELNNTINNNSNSNISLNKNYTYNNNDTNFKNGIIINRTLTIEGNGYTIDGNKMACIFNVTEGNLTLKNINIINAYGGDALPPSASSIHFRSGSAIYSIYSNITIINSTFMNNKVNEHSDGGAIYNRYGHMTITNSTFISNTAKIGTGSNGGAICCSYGDVSIINSTFINNTADGGGAIYCYSGNTSIINSEFINNSAKSTGGAVLQNQLNTTGSINWLTVINSTFINNNGLEGGAIGSQYLNAYNSTFINNTAKGYQAKGGALYIYTGDIKDCNFTDNYGTSGGAIFFVYGNSTITNLKFINNTASSGGAIYIGLGHPQVNETSHLTIIDSEFLSNTATSRGGAIYSDLVTGSMNSADYVAIINSQFTSNNANSGGAIYNGGRGIISDSRFINNNASSGGAIYNNERNENTDLSINNSEFSSNHANYGGAIYNPNNTNINNTDFINNTAINGGAIYVTGSINISNSKFNGNNATSGGAIYSIGIVFIANSEFSANNATSGGAINHDNINNYVNEYMKSLIEELESLDSEEYEQLLDEIKRLYNMTLEEYLEMFHGQLVKQAESQFPNNKGHLIVVNSSFDKNHGKLGDDIYTTHNTALFNNNYTKNSYGNIYAENTIVNGTIVSVLENNTYYIITGNKFKLNATVFVDGASVNGYNLTITDGTNNYTAIYKGYGIYEIGEEITVDFKIKKYSAIIYADNEGNYTVENGTVVNNIDVKIEVELDEAIAGGNITGNITLKDENNEIANITGQVTVEIEGKNYTVDVVEGKGQFNIEDEFGPGDYEMKVSYPGNEKYNPANITANFTIIDAGEVLTVYNLTKYYGNGSKFIIILTDSQGNPIANQMINITINGVTYTRTTDENGTIQMSINLIPGIYETAVSYGNITQNATITVLTTIEAENLIKYFKNGTQYYAQFLNLDGTPLANTNVTFNIHGVFYTRTTDENGIAKLNINLNPGEYIITAFNPVNNESKANVITVLTTIFGENVVKFYRNGTQYYAYVLDENGNPLANANVTFNIHGVFYNRTTDEDGMVKLNINLNPGEYIITAWNLWNGEATSNNITVYNVVLSEDLEMTTSARKPFKVTILGEQGKPLANAKVVFNIHGVFYEKTTDVNGQVSLDINLIAGKYIITTYYNEYAVSNTIIVK